MYLIEKYFCQVTIGALGIALQSVTCHFDRKFCLNKFRSGEILLFCIKIARFLHYARSSLRSK